jgi:hypothetical protein
MAKDSAGTAAQEKISHRLRIRRSSIGSIINMADFSADPPQLISSIGPSIESATWREVQDSFGPRNNDEEPPFNLTYKTNTSTPAAAAKPSKETDPTTEVMEASAYSHLLDENMALQARVALLEARVDKLETTVAGMAHDCEQVDTKILDQCLALVQSISATNDAVAELGRALE